MKSSARVRANRANAQRSTGPKTASGKSRVAQNAVRHGLAIPVEADPDLAAAIERLACAIAGQGADQPQSDDAARTRPAIKPLAGRGIDHPSRLDCARRVAEAQLDLVRVRRARVALLNDVKARAKEPSVRELIHTMKQTESEAFRQGGGVDERGRAVLRALGGVNADFEPLTLGQGFMALAAQLMRLDRYERRALSRRKFAIRDWDQYEAQLASGCENA